MSYRLFLFDLDGTLIDTSPGILSALRKTEQALGIKPLPDETLQKFIGPPLEWSFEEYYGVSPEEAVRRAKTYREIYGTDGVYESKLYPFIKETLRFIREHGGKSAVCSLKIDRMVDLTLGCYDLAQLFDAIVGRSAENPTKADTVRTAMETLCWEDPTKAVLLGDSRYDGEGAEAAGVAFLPITYGFGFAEPHSLDGLPRVGKAASPEDVFRFVKAQF